MIEMKKYKIKDFAKTCSGGTPTSSRREFYEGGTIPWINSGELSQSFITNTSNYITELGYNSSSAKMFPKDDTVLLAMYGATAGKASLLQINACTNQAICAIILDKSVADPLYLKYKLDTMYDYLVRLSSGSARDNLSQAGIANLEVDLPPLSVQQKVASVLSSLDKKIALNKQINQNLEALARQLYDYWFVQFDFPNEEGKPYKSSGGKMVYNPILKREIPDGWHCGNLYEIAKFTNGLACQKYRPESNEESLRVIKIREMHEGFSKDTEFVTSNIPETVKVYNGDVLFSWSASLEVMLWAKGAGGLNQHIFKVTSANDFPKSFYYYQLLNYVSLFKQMAEARKTTMGHITQDHLEQSRLAIPDSKEITYQLEGNLAPIFEAIINNESEISSLTKQRDELLPLLINGQVNFDLSDD